MVLASSSGTPVPAIARLVAADDDTVRDVIHAFNHKGSPRWTLTGRAGRPAGSADDDVAFIAGHGRTRPKKLGLPFTRWSIRKLTAYLRRYGITTRPVPARSSRSAGNGCGRSCTNTTSASSAPGPGRNPPTRPTTPNWTASTK